MSLTKTILLFVILSCCVIADGYSGGDNYLSGARSAAMVSASVMMTDIWAAANNQAGLGYIEQPTAALYYGSCLNVKSLSQRAGVFAWPVKSTTIAANYRYFGFSKYNESRFGLAVGKKIGEKFALGIQMDYLHTHFSDNYGNFGVLCGEVGLLCTPVENLTVGAHLFNVSQSKQKANPDEKVPTVMRFGIGYTIQDKATVSVETEKDLRMDAVFKGGLEYKPIDKLYFRCGVSTGLLYQYAFGLGYGWKAFTVDVAFSHHKFLGYNPHISLIANL